MAEHAELDCGYADYHRLLQSAVSTNRCQFAGICADLQAHLIISLKETLFLNLSAKL